MTPFKFILAATDFSVPANNAVHRAALLAKQHGARLSIVHVIVPARRMHFRAWLSTSIDRDPQFADARDETLERGFVGGMFRRGFFAFGKRAVLASVVATHQRPAIENRELHRSANPSIRARTAGE